MFSFFRFGSKKSDSKTDYGPDLELGEGMKVQSIPTFYPINTNQTTFNQTIVPYQNTVTYNNLPVYTYDNRSSYYTNPQH